MKIHISENIRNLRKQQGMMQEQLAEALGVSIGAVSKWERGAAVPDLSYIVAMADLFGTSVDALVGYEVQSGARKVLEDRIRSLQEAKDYEKAAIEAEKALIRYPNDFSIVYRCGEMYLVKGIETNHMPAVERGAELLNHATLLLSQNTDPEINAFTIQYKIAQCYIVLGKTEQGIELLKKHNVGGVHNALIGMTYAASECCEPAEAAPFLMKAFEDSLTSLVQIMTGYATYYARIGDDASALDAVLWLIQYLESIKISEDAVSYVDKIRALFYAECAYLSDTLNKTADVEPYLRQALQIARKFDAAPVYNIRSVKFCIGEVKEATAYDDIGSTAMEAIEQQRQGEEWSEGLRNIWKRLKEDQ